MPSTAINPNQAQFNRITPHRLGSGLLRKAFEAWARLSTDISNSLQQPTAENQGIGLSRAEANALWAAVS
jgi:hypothetical protein